MTAPPSSVGTVSRARLALVVCLVVLAALSAAGGYVQAIVSKVYVICSGHNDLSFYGMTVVTLLSMVLYLAAPFLKPAAVLYRVVQAAMLLLCVWQGIFTSSGHPRTVLLCVAISVVPAAVALAFRRLRGTDDGSAWPATGTFVPLAGFSFLLVTILVTAFLGPLLMFRAEPLANWQLGIGLAGAVVGTILLLIPVAGALPRRTPGQWLELTPPLAVLVMTLARAKFPDQSFDAILYKSSLPLQIAEWRTAATGMLDHALVGTNFQELINGLLRMLASDYEPRFISTIACAIFYLIAASAFRLGTDLPGGTRLVRSLACVSMLCLTEVLNGQGTVYHEALFVLLLAASLAPVAIWPIFLAAGVSVKMTVVFVAPLVVLHQLRTRIPWRPAPVALLLVSLVAGVFVFGTQIERNVAYTGRVLGFPDLLASVTDPPSSHSVLTAASVPLSPEMDYHASVNPRDHHTARGGVLHNTALAVCNLVALDLVCPTDYDGLQNFGFHIFPASRALVLSMLLAAGLLVGAGGRIFGWPRLAAVALFFGVFATFSQVTEGRHLAAASTGFAILLVTATDTLASALDRFGRAAMVGAAVFGAFLVGGDFLPGMMTNIGWDCRHDLWASPVEAQPAPSDAAFKFAQSLGTKYKQQCEPPGLPPSIVGENGMLLGPYLGVHRVASIISDDLNARFLDVAPERRNELSRSVLAFAYTSPRFFRYMAGLQVDRFETCFKDATMTIACSKDLPPIGHQCARRIMDNRVVPPR